MSASEQPLPSRKEELLSVAGYVLGISYPLLAISTGFRAVFQLFFKEDVTNYLAPSLSLIAAVCYLFATVGFFYRKRWAWNLSVGVLGFETVLTLVVGTLSFIYPDLIGRTVWSRFGADYGWFPLIQPLLGLVWLYWPQTRQAYGFTD